MTNAEIIQAIRKEIGRRYNYEKEMYCDTKPDGRPNDGWAESLAIMGVLEELLSFLSTIEKSEKPINPEEIDLKKELHDFIMEFGPAATFDKCASRFYDLGCHRTAEKYDEIEYNRQRAEESVCGELEKEIKRYYDDWDGNCRYAQTARHFAQWGAEHLKK